jgi:pyruvate dehydrogenase E2 component (dihydrolipoamide acetyltransferase)
MAQREGIDLVTVRGTGRRGQILKRDVERALTSAQAEPGLAGGARREPVTAMRRAIARRTQLSKAEAPHFYADITVDMAEALALRQAAVEWANQKGWAPPSLTDLCLRATALTLPDFPTLNASFQEEEVIYYQAINIGLVVGLADGGMLVPVVREADGANLYTLAAITRRLKEQAEKGHLKETELSGGTFTLSNLGMYGLDSFTAVINPPQAGILALGAVQERPAVHGGDIVPRPLMQATLSVDHRLVDGIVAARFLATWKELLENPTRLTLEPPEKIG